MKICLIAKYPPIEGGESSKAYWLAKGLGENGCEVHVITNAWEVESNCRENITSSEIDGNYQPKGVYVHNTDPFIEPSYIPYSKPYTEKIASLAIDIIKEYDLQLIDSWYILPYVISGFLAKTITDRPQIMRHAGSDMNRLLSSPYLETLFTSIFKKVDKIVTYPNTKEKFLSFGVPEENIFLNTKVSVDTRAFNPEVKPIDLSFYTNQNIDNLPIITYIGKIGITKGIYELAEAASKIKENFLLLFVSKGKNLDGFKQVIEKLGLKSKALFIDFVPPWKIPSVIKRSTCVVIPERDFPVVQHTPILPREVMAVGKCLILSEELYVKRRSIDIQDKENILVVDPKNIEQFRTTLEKIIKQPDYAEKIGQRAWIVSKKIERFDVYIEEMINFYANLIKEKTLLSQNIF